MILGTAGHIDHGKTALVRALTGVDTDRLPEEKRRGITIDLGFAPLPLEGVGVAGVVDVPGHEAFVRTMLAGASGVDLALLVVAADEGVMPQTREHLAILRLLGVERLVVALTKCDLVDEEWLALVRDDVGALLAATPMRDAPLVATSVVSGAGLDLLRATLAGAARTLPRRDPHDLFRLPIDRAFTVKGTGTVVTGTVWSGTLARDATVHILPAGRTARVRGLQNHGSAVDRVEPGQRVAVALAGISVEEVGRGSVLVADESWRASQVLRAEVALLEAEGIEIGPRTRVRFHLGTSDVGARLVARGGALRAGERRAVRVLLEHPVVARAGDRFVVRAASPAVTIAGGVVVDPESPRRARPWPVALTPSERLLALIEEGGPAGLARSSLPVRLGLSSAAAEELVRAAGDRVTTIGDRLIARGVFARLDEELRTAVASHHCDHPLDPGLPIQLARSRLRAPAAVVDAALAALTAAAVVEIEGAVVRLAGFRPTLGERQQRLAAELRAHLAAHRLEPPSLAELVAHFGDAATEIVHYLARTGELIQVEPDRFWPADAVAELTARLRAGMTPGREYAPGDLRDLLGFSRKFLIPFLEYCDRVGLTRRGTAGRVWTGG